MAENENKRDAPGKNAEWLAFRQRNGCGCSLDAQYDTAQVQRRARQQHALAQEGLETGAAAAQRQRVARRGAPGQPRRAAGERAASSRGAKRGQRRRQRRKLHARVKHSRR